MLHPVERDHQRLYCGPWALAALTGAPLDVVRAVVRQTFEERASQHRTRTPREIVGMYNAEMYRALELLGHRAESLQEWDAAGADPVTGWYRRLPRPTLREWCQQLARLNAPGLFLVHCGWHYVSAAQDPSGELWLSDNLQRGPTPVRWRDFRGASKRMWRAWAVTPLGAR